MLHLCFLMQNGVYHTDKLTGGDKCNKSVAFTHPTHLPQVGHKADIYTLLHITKLYFFIEQKKKTHPDVGQVERENEDERSESKKWQT